MKKLILLTITGIAMAESGETDQRLAAERARREYYELILQINQLQKQADAKAVEANRLVDQIKAVCDARKGALDPNTLECKVKESK